MAVPRSLIVFGIIGGINTAIDIGLFVGLHNAGLPILLANIISTSVALGVSFALNSKFTFNDREGLTRSKITRFLGVTLTGLWVLQPIVIGIVLHALHNVSILSLGSYSNLDTTIAKFLSIPVTLTWNYVLYKRVVFKSKS